MGIWSRRSFVMASFASVSPTVGHNQMLTLKTLLKLSKKLQNLNATISQVSVHWIGDLTLAI